MRALMHHAASGQTASRRVSFHFPLPACDEQGGAVRRGGPLLAAVRSLAMGQSNVGKEAPSVSPDGNAPADINGGPLSERDAAAREAGRER